MMSVQSVMLKELAAVVKERSLARLEGVVEAAVADGKTIVFVDMSGMDWLSPKGAEHLVRAYRRGREAGVQITVTGATPRCRRLLSLLALDSALRLD